MVKKLTKQDLIDWALEHGWTLDRYGNLHVGNDERRYRLKLSDISARLELRVDHEAGGSEWIRLKSAYLKDITVTPEGKLLGLR